MTTIELKDFLNFSFLSDVKLSANAQKVAYLRHKCNIKKDNYDTRLYVNDLNGKNTVMDFEENINVYCWDKSDDLLLFGVYSDKSTIFYRLDIKTMDVTQAFTVNNIIKTIECINKNKYLLSTRVNIKNLDLDDDCVIINELPIQANGTGYVSGTRNTLFIYDEKQNTKNKILPEYFETFEFTFCEDNNKILAIGHEFNDYRIIRSGIYLYDIESNTGKTVLEKGTYRISYLSMIRDKIVFAGTLGKNNSIMENPYFYKLDIDTLEVEEFSKPDYYIMALGISSDCRYGSGNLCLTSNNKIYFNAAKIGDGHLFRIEDNGDVKQITINNGSVDIFDTNGEIGVFIGFRDMKLQELYKIDIETGKEVQLTDFNESYVKDKSIMKPVDMFFKNRDGIEISGWVLLPKDYDKTKMYPAVLDIHGGPKTAYGKVYYHEMQLLANKGYFVYFCNPRGSDGNGDDFSIIAGKNGTIDYEDIMDFTDYVLNSFESIDRKKLGVMGGSYGGFMTNWIVGHTHMFAAAVTQRSIGDWVVHEYAADTGYWVTSEAYPPNAIVQAEKAWSQSPGKYGLNIKTPILFIHSGQDTRCPLAEAMSVYSGATQNGAETRMCFFLNENHELSRSGKPSNRIKRLEEITSWLDKYLMPGGSNDCKN